MTRRPPETRTSGIHVIVDRLVLRPNNRHRLIEAIEVAFQEAEGLCHVDVNGQGLRTYSTHFRCQGCGRGFGALRPLLFSFNHPLGRARMQGFRQYPLGMTGTRHPRSQQVTGRWCHRTLEQTGVDQGKQLLLAMKRMDVDLTTPFRDLSPRSNSLIWEGSEQVEGIRQYFDHLETKRYKLTCVLLSRYRSPACPPHMPG